MSVAAQPSAKSSAPQLDDMPVPVTSVALAPSLPGSPVPPAHRIYFYSPGEWEVFITEWATGLTVSYRQIKRLGGPNDRGVDVAAFKTERGGLTPFRRSGRYASRPVARGGGQGDWSDHDEQ